MSTMKVDNGNAILKKLMQLSSDNTSTNDALYFLSKDYMDKLAYQSSLEEGAIGGIFSAEVKEYIRLKKNQYKHRLFSDAGISGTMENLMNDALAWSNFVERYPNFAKAKEARRTQEYLENVLFYGSDNTPAYDFDTKVASQKFRDLWSTTLETYPNAPFAKKLYNHVQKLESNNWKLEKL